MQIGLVATWLAVQECFGLEVETVKKSLDLDLGIAFRAVAERTVYD